MQFYRFFIPLLCLSFLTISCKPTETPQPPPPPSVSVMKPLNQELTNYLFYNGITRGIKQTEVRPRVSGYLDKVLFKPDTQVQAGTPLFLIDPRPYQVAVDRAEAELKGKQATIQSAMANLERVKKLAVQQAASDQELIDRQAAYDLAVADEKVVQAELNEAKLNLAFTEVRAPISGRISRNLVDEGTLLRVNEPVLATIVNDDQIYVDFQVSEAEFLDYLRKNPDSRTEKAPDMAPHVIEMAMADEADYSRAGRIVSGDNTVDPATATYGVRGLFDNPDKQIAPGLYVRLRTIMGTAKCMLIPDVAIQADQLGKFVYIASTNKDGQTIVSRRSVETGQPAGAYRRILKGIEEGELIVFNGLTTLRPEAHVTPVFDPPPPPPPAPSTQPSTQPAATQPAQ